MTRKEIEARLKSAFPDSDFVVTDLTGTEDHYDVQISSTIFQGLSRMAQHQAVMRAFAAELKTGEVHALSIKTLAKS